MFGGTLKLALPPTALASPDTLDSADAAAGLCPVTTDACDWLLYLAPASSLPRHAARLAAAAIIHYSVGLLIVRHDRKHIFLH